MMASQSMPLVSRIRSQTGCIVAETALESSQHHALIEVMCDHNMGVEDPYLELFESRQLTERFAAFQRGLIDEMANLYGL